LPFPERAASHAYHERSHWAWTDAATRLHPWAALRPLAAPLATAVLAYVSMGALLYSQAFHFYDAGNLAEIDFLRRGIYVLAPNALLQASRYDPLGVAALLLYGLLSIALVASWCWALRAARRIDTAPLAGLLALSALLALPAIGFTALFSDDIYLYHLYGRTIEAYGANPIWTPPANFSFDPHLERVFWKYLPSSYGPLWLMLSAALSRIAGESITAALLAYRVLGLLLHLSTAAAIWYVVRPRGTQAAIAATVFYAWNPLVILEIVANAHNDVLVALFAVTLVGASARRAWSAAAFFGACAVMVKPFAVLLLPPIALRIFQATPRRTWLGTFAAAGATALALTVALSLPFWAGLQLLRNVMNNPASHMYTNTLWELVSETGALFGVSAAGIQHPYLDVIRLGGLIAGALWILSRRWSRRGVAHTAFALWITFLLTACWAWPWYFVPAIALAPLSGRRAVALAACLTVGGVLFWATWPPPTPVAWLYTARSVVLFGPVVIAICSPRARRLILRALGEERSTTDIDRDPSPARLQTATG
jgi:hypothetical protein